MNLWSYYISVALLMYPFVAIYQRAGQSGALALIMLVPYVGILLSVYVLAFISWPKIEGE